MPSCPLNVFLVLKKTHISPEVSSDITTNFTWIYVGNKYTKGCKRQETAKDLT